MLWDEDNLRVLNVLGVMYPLNEATLNYTMETATVLLISQVCMRACMRI